MIVIWLHIVLHFSLTLKYFTQMETSLRLVKESHLLNAYDPLERTDLYRVTPVVTRGLVQSNSRYSRPLSKSVPFSF